MTLAIKMLKLTDLEKRKKTHEKYVPKTTSQEPRSCAESQLKYSESKRLSIYSVLSKNIQKDEKKT